MQTYSIFTLEFDPSVPEAVRADVTDAIEQLESFRAFPVLDRESPSEHDANTPQQWVNYGADNAAADLDVEWATIELSQNVERLLAQRGLEHTATLDYQIIHDDDDGASTEAERVWEIRHGR